MPIEKGKPWGEPAEPPPGLTVLGSDGEAHAAIEQARHGRRPYPEIGLTGGDLCRTLGGGTGSGLTGVRFTVDVGVALLDGRVHLFLAHLVARNRLWTRALVAMNAQWLGGWNLGPRAHPGDGLLDTYDVHLRPAELPAVRSRLGHGTHLPHPGIQERRTTALQVELERSLPVILDGRRCGEARKLSLRVEPDALVVYV